MNEETKKLSQLLIQEKNIAADLLDLMLEEKNAIEEGLVDKLQPITDKKTACLDQLETISRHRAQLLLALSTAPTTVDRMKQYIAKQSSPIRDNLYLAVENLEDILEKCRHQNSINGMVISMSQRNVQRNLNIIKGADQESVTYTQKGQTTSVGKIYSGLKV